MTCEICQDGSWLRDFENELVWGAGLADSSLRSVRYELRRWVLWLEERARCWRDVTRQDLQTWLTDIHDRQAARTVDKRSWVLRRLYRWAVLEGHIEADPWSAIEKPARRTRWEPRFVPSRKQVALLLAQPDLNTLKGIRDRAILELLYGAGLRASELLHLEYHQVSSGLKDRCFKVLGKARHERLVIYGEPAAIWLGYYIQIARCPLLSKAGHCRQFFVNDTDSGCLTYPVMQRAIKRYARAADVPMVTAHALRHAFATHLYQAGANLRVIQVLLGHSMLETTCVYARTSTDQLQTLIDRHHPKGRDYVSLPMIRSNWQEDATARHRFMYAQPESC